jgi:hypothetical protein
LEPYTAETKPELEFDETDIENLDAVYRYLRHWALRVKLNLKPAMPAGVIRRAADNVRGLLAIAESCGSDWDRRMREALTVLLEKEKSERPQVKILRHGLEIMNRLGVEQLGSIRFNKELRQLDLSDARWMRYRGPSGMDYAHPIELYEQAGLLRLSSVHSIQLRLPGKHERGGNIRGYTYAQLEEALRKYYVKAPDDSEPGRVRLRLVTPKPE